MSTSPEDTNPTDDSGAAAETAATSTAGAGGDAAAGTGATTSDAAEDAPAARGSAAATADASASGAGGAFLAGATPTGPPPASGGLFAAETFSVIGLLLFALTTLHTRLFELFSWFFLSGAAPSHSPEQASMLAAEVAVSGGLSALSVLAAAVALFRSGAATRAWSRWSAAATVVVGSLLLLVSVLTFVGLPTGG